MRSAARPARAKKKPNHERWLVSYADLLTLLLALFVVLYASSTRNKDLVAEVEMGMQRAFHATPISIMNTHTAGNGILQHAVSTVQHPIAHPATHLQHATPKVSKQLEAELVALQNVQVQLSTLLQPMTATKKVSMAAQPLTLVISFDASALFPSGKATLVKPAVTLLGNVAKRLTKLPNQFSIVIQGYTDNKPIDTAQFPSNWSLSAERAVSVVSLFMKQGIDGTRLSAQGFGEFAPFAPNTTAAGRAQNRRVVVVIHAMDPNGP